jgi:hypothetical protein
LNQAEEKGRVMNRLKLGFFLLAVIIAGLGAGPTWSGEPSWSMEGLAVVTDNCSIGCPCIFGKPFVIENSLEPLFYWTCLGKATGSFYRGGGQNFRFEGTSGESHKFAFKGGGSSK